MRASIDRDDGPHSIAQWTMVDGRWSMDDGLMFDVRCTATTGRRQTDGREGKNQAVHLNIIINVNIYISVHPIQHLFIHGNCNQHKTD